VTVRITVSAHGLDLASPADADRFLRRLNAAVTRACDDRPVGSSVFLGRSAGFHTCRAAALEAAIAEVYAPVVRQRYAALRQTDDDLRR
jgi:UrcA family protein